jgi:hypothetical protein
MLLRTNTLYWQPYTWSTRRCNEASHTHTHGSGRAHTESQRQRRVRRVNDNVETDFFSDQYGNLAAGDGTLIVHFLSGTTGRITTVYNQNGTGSKINMNVSNCYLDGHPALNSTTTVPLDARYVFVLTSECTIVGQQSELTTKRWSQVLVLQD